MMESIVLAELWVIVKPRNRGIFRETFSRTAQAAWDEFYVGGVCADAINPDKDCDKLGYRAKKVKIVLEEVL